VSKLRRPHGEGAFYTKVKCGTTWYVGRASYLDEFGHRKWKTVWSKTPGDRKMRFRELQRQIDAGDFSRPRTDKRISLAVYVGDWLNTTAKRHVQPSTWLRYESLYRVHLEPFTDKLQLTTLRALDVLQLYDALRRRGRSDSTLKKLHGVLHAALGDAVPDLIPVNPVAMISRRKKPKYKAPESDAYTIEELYQFLAAAASEPELPLYVLAITSQMREGEIFALSIDDVDFEQGAVFVRRGLQDAPDGKTITGKPRARVRIAKTKTSAGRRRIDLPVIALHALRVQIEGVQARRVSGIARLVFPSELGGPLLRRNFLRRKLYPLMKRAGLRRITFHALRHSGNTALAARVPLLALKDRLGHANIKTTADIYAHRSPAIQQLTVAVLDELFPPNGGERGGEGPPVIHVPEAL
jgi:integrase